MLYNKENVLKVVEIILTEFEEKGYTPAMTVEILINCMFNVVANVSPLPSRELLGSLFDDLMQQLYDNIEILRLQEQQNLTEKLEWDDNDEKPSEM